MRCQWTTERVGVTGSRFDLYSKGGGQCSREAIYTNGQTFVCKQHAKEFATVLRKATNKIRDGYYKIRSNDND
jgi:hypothetical protein